MRSTVANPAEVAGSRERGATAPFAWQGWSLRLPASWNPVKLEGDFASGFALLADLDGPRLGLRWKTVDASKATPAHLMYLLASEVGDAGRMTDDAAVRLDPDPPGRDVAVRYSRPSGRIVQLAYHARRRDAVLVDDLLPLLADAAALPSRPWAVLDLACAVPADLPLASQRLHAGDLSLSFGRGARFVTIRQVALAAIALKRTPLEGWLAVQQRETRATHRPGGEPSPVTVETRDGRELTGFSSCAPRLRRFAWNAGLAPQRFALALRDDARDRIVLIDASSEALAREVVRTVGCDFDR